jgi:hypothetical protein
MTTKCTIGRSAAGPDRHRFRSAAIRSAPLPTGSVLRTVAGEIVGSVRDALS